MKAWAVALVASVAAVPAVAQVEFRWFKASANLGIQVAGVRNVNGSYFRFTCSPSGIPGEGPSLQYDAADDRTARKPGAIQVVVDGEAFLFEIDASGLTVDETNRGAVEMRRVADKLAGAKSGYFEIEVPSKNFSERFSLKDVRQALGKPRQNLLSKCR